MALVAYSDDSDLGTDSEDGEEASKITDKNGYVDDRASSPPPAAGAEGEVTDEEDDYIGDDKKSSGLFASVPAAVSVSSAVVGEEDDDEVTDVPTVDTWAVTRQLREARDPPSAPSGTAPPQPPGPASATLPHVHKKKDRRKVQFFLPALSEFADEDDEEEWKEPEKKKLRPSSGGSGLFSVLPEPKHICVKETKRSLVPHILTKKTEKAQEPPKQKTATRTLVAEDTNVSDDEAPLESSDFFSLSEPLQPSPSLAAESGVLAGRGAAVTAPDTLTHGEPVHGAQVVHAVAENTTKPEEPPPQVEAYQDFYALETTPSSSELQVTTGNTGIDEEAMLRLTGKRRGKDEVINFIDVSADDALLTRQEWMTKALTEEKPVHGFSKKREGLPTQKQKQKHQITYLAHQAKERELELKNNWAQNKMTKMQSQAKYGF